MVADPGFKLNQAHSQDVLLNWSAVAVKDAKRHRSEGNNPAPSVTPTAEPSPSPTPATEPPVSPSASPLPSPTLPEGHSISFKFLQPTAEYS